MAYLISGNFFDNGMTNIKGLFFLEYIIEYKMYLALKERTQEFLFSYCTFLH